MKKIIISIVSVIFASMLATSSVFAYGFGIGPARDGNNCPQDAKNFHESHKEQGAYALSEDENVIILTFDQGYENGYTTEILDILKEKNVSAIFFLTGDYAKSEHALVQRMIDEGHMLGNHGMTHASLCDISADKAEEEVLSLHAYVMDNYDYEMQYFRFPCGEYDEECLELVRDCGYKTLFWSFAYVDWLTDKQPEIENAYNIVTDAAHGGAIYLLHSVSSTNAAILGRVIDNLRSKGYTL